MTATNWKFPTGTAPFFSNFNSRGRKFWVVWKPGTGPSKRHYTCTEARNEARRLAEHHPGETFIVLMSDSAFSIQSVEAVHFT